MIQRVSSPLPHRLVLRRIAGAVCSAVVVMCAHRAAAGPTPAPVAAPGQSVPSHAAGGWPTDLTGDDKKPARTPEQQAAIDELANELKRLANQFGPDSVILQAKLLIRSMGAGAVGPTEVRVAGPSAEADHLEIDVETGLFFDEKTTTAESRRDTVWKDVAMPVLDEMVSFKIEPEALELVFLFDVQDVAAVAGTAPDPTAPARHEAFRVRLSRPILEDLIADRLVGDAAHEKVEFTPAVTVPRPEASRPH